MKYDVIIVGAGASGMMAAITAASHHKKVLLLERMDKLGKKILATGNEDAICQMLTWTRIATEGRDLPLPIR